MTIDELIKKLQEIKSEFGDVEIRYMNMPIRSIYKHSFENWIRIE